MSKFFSMGEYIKEYNAHLKKACSFRADTKEEWLAWKSEFYEKLYDLMGIWPQDKPELQPVVTEEFVQDGILYKKIIIRSERAMNIPFYLLTPQDGKPDKRPVVFCLHGHGQGKDDVLGMNHGLLYKDYELKATNYPLAPKLAKAGYAVVAPDARGFGERALGADSPHRGASKDGCDELFLKCSLLGLNPLTLNIWDVGRCIDFLETCPDIDSQRIGCAGLSFGGTWSLYTAIFEKRIKVATVSGYLNNYSGFALEWGNFCGSQIVPGLLRYGEMGDVAALLAPKPVLFTHGLSDGGFPMEDTKVAYQTVRKAYEVAGCLENTKLDLFEGGHEFHDCEIIDWFDNKL